MIEVVLPTPLVTLAHIQGSLEFDLPPPVTVRRLLDALEERYPALRGTIREHGRGERRKYLRFFACGQDISQQSQDQELPAEVCQGQEPFLVVGAMSGGCS